MAGDEWDETTPQPVPQPGLSQVDMNSAALIEHGKRLGDLTSRIERIEEAQRRLLTVAETALKVAEFTRRRLAALKRRLLAAFGDDDTKERE